MTLSLCVYAGFDAGLHLCAVSACHRRRICSVVVFARCDCAPCFYAGLNRVSRCGVAFVCSLGHSGIRATSGHVGPLGHSGTVATWWAGSSQAAEQGHWARLPGGAALRGRAGRAQPRARRDLLVPGICRWWSSVWGLATRREVAVVVFPEPVSIRSTPAHHRGVSSVHHVARPYRSPLRHVPSLPGFVKAP